MALNKQIATIKKKNAAVKIGITPRNASFSKTVIKVECFCRSMEKITKYKCSSNETYKKQLDYFFKQYFDKNFNIMNNFSEASKTFKKIIGFKKGNC